MTGVHLISMSLLAPLIALCGSACLESTIPVHLRFDEVISENAVKVVRFGTEEFPSMVRAQLTVTPTNGIIKVGA